MIKLADCFRVPRLDAAPDLLWGDAALAAQQSYQYWCSFVSTSFAGLVSHARHKHGFRRTAYNYLTDNGDCFGCLRTFHTKRRLLDHLTRVKHPVCHKRGFLIVDRESRHRQRQP